MLSIDAWLDEKPYREVFDDAIHEKVSPQTDHGVVAGHLYRLLDDWGCQRGLVIIELRVYLAPGTTLVPDVAFISGRRLATLSDEERQKPPFAPEIVCEVRSPEDREARIKRKTELYLKHGATLVLNVDPQQRSIRVTTRDGERTLFTGDALEHASYPELHVTVDDVFSPLDRFR